MCTITVCGWKFCKSLQRKLFSEMSSFIKDIFQFVLVKVCCKYKAVFLKPNNLIDKSIKDESNLFPKSCNN